MYKFIRKANLIITVVGVLLSLYAASPLVPKAAALSGGDFSAGRIIDDSIFYNSQSLSIQQIQDFLNSKVPTCDTWGTQARGNTTRAAYGASVGNPAPYTCLKDYRQTTVVKQPEAGLCNGYPAANQSSAEIIYNVAQSCGISPRVLLVLLQKEQSLITDDWPWPIQYQSATGYGCPDTAACDTQYYGFFNQVYSAARGYKYYAKYPDSFNYISSRNNYVQYNPSANCGGSTIMIQNQATAGLYNYTPYQPNAAALNNLYGTGDNCSAYGNRNFWRMFNDWFGSTNDNIPVSYTVRLVTPIVLSPAMPTAGQQTTATYTVQNFGSQSVTYQASVLQCRVNVTSNCDSAWGAPITLSAGEQRTFSDNFTPTQGGNYTVTPYFQQGNVWYRYGSSSTNSISVSVPDMRIISPITTNPGRPVAGETATVQFTVQNFGTQAVNYQTSIIQCRLNGGTVCDSNYGGAVTVQPGQQLPVLYYLPAAGAGTNAVIPYYMQNNTWYQYGVATGLQNNVVLEVPDLRLTGPITASPSSPIPGQAVTVSYTVKNYSTVAITTTTSILQCRLNISSNCDPDYDSPLVLNPGEQKAFNITFPAVKAGSYNFTPFYSQNDSWYRYSSATSNSLRLDVPAYLAPMWLHIPLSATPSNPTAGQSVTINYTILNPSDKPAIYQASILQCRFNTSTNCDPGYDSPITLAPDEQRAMSATFSAVKTGTYVFTPYYMQNDNWYRYGSNTTNALRIDVR